MAANVLPFILVAGAAAVLLGRKKKKRKRTAVDEYVPVDIPPPPPPPAKAPADAPVPSEIWKQRQTALAYLGGLGICDCNPGLPDGIYGKNTRHAILGFQTYANIGRTGKWDQPTATMMSRALEMAAKGLIKIPKKPTPKPAPAPKPSGLGYDLLNPSTWPDGKIATPSGVRDESWLPVNMALILPWRTKSWEYQTTDPWRGFDALVHAGAGYEPKGYAVKISVPIGTEVWAKSGYNLYTSNREDWIRYYFKVASSIRNLAEIYPEVNFELRYWAPKEIESAAVLVSFAKSKVLSGGILHASDIGSKVVKRIKLNMPTPTPDLVGAITGRIREVF